MLIIEVLNCAKYACFCKFTLACDICVCDCDDLKLCVRENK